MKEDLKKLISALRMGTQVPSFTLRQQAADKLEDMHKTIQELHDQVAQLFKEGINRSTELGRKQIALVRIYRIFDEEMHDCKLDLSPEERIKWMQNIAKEASHKTAPVGQAVEKKSKTVGVGMAGERSGFTRG